MKRLSFVLCAALCAAGPSAVAQATLASLNGTYTFQMVELNDYSVATNMNGQQVGFCNSPVVGYGCFESYTFDRFAGSLVADGAGHITSVAYSITRDPNSYQCSPKANPTKPCPVIVPSGHVYSASTAYAIGATVDYTVGTVTRTFQAVRTNTGKPPNWGSTTDAAYICNYNANNLNTCLWTQVPKSLTSGNSNSTGDLTGTYTIQANGSGVMSWTQTNCANCVPVEMAFTVSPVSQVGQSISIAGISQLGNAVTLVGSGVRTK